MRYTNKPIDVNRIACKFSEAYRDHNVPESQLYGGKRGKEVLEWQEEDKNLYYAIDKLSALEDFEEEYGIDLAILHKVLTEGIWAKDEKYNPCVHKIEPSELNVSLRDGYAVIQELYFEDLDCVMDTTGRKWVFKDYGKTWALTEEELL